MDDNILSNNEWKESDYRNPPDTTADSFFKPYLKIHKKNNIEKEDEQSQMKRKSNDGNLEANILNNTSNPNNINDEQPNKRVCKAEKFEAIKYSLGPNKEYISIRRCEYNAWERNEDNPDYSSKNHVRKFLRTLPFKWRAKVMAIEKAKVATLPLDELVGNLQVKSLALKPKVTRERTSDDNDSQEGSDEDIDEEEEVEAFNLLARNFQKSFRKGNWFGRGIDMVASNDLRDALSVIFGLSVTQAVMSVDSAVTYTSVHSEARSWSIPFEDPYEEAARQLPEQAPRSPEYVPDPMELEDHVPVYIPKPEHPEDLVPAKDEAPIEAYITEVASAPPPPPSFLPSLIRPPRTRAAIAQMRAAAPSTYHPLLPSGTPPLLPIPLPALSTSRRVDIPQADMLPQKRLLLTSPKPGCEVGESSAAAAAR
ncbi:hypothetical protein Tco_0488789 [Tanacetum coccineum]